MLFSTSDREAAKEYLINLAKQNTDIAAGVLLGSAAYGYIDELSDIDLCIMVNSEENIESAMSYMLQGVKAYRALLCCEQLTHRRLQVYLLDNFLELNISFQSIDSINITKGDWKVVFDKNGDTETKIKKSWATFQATQKENALSVNETVKAYANETWHFFFHCATAIKRAKYWRAIGELDIIRGRLLELKGLRYSVDIGRRHRDVDNLPAHELALIQKTMVTDISRETLSNCMSLLLDAVYDELDMQGATPFYSVTRQQIREYVNYVSKIESE